MPVLKNARHEKFAQALAKGKTADEAYVDAGYSFNRGNAARMKANESIRKRTKEITARVSEKAEWSAADRLISLKALHDASLKEDKRTAIAAIAEANKMQGSYAPTKHQHAGANGGPIQSVDLTNLDADDLERLEALFGPLAGGPGDDDEGDTGGESSTGG